MTTFEQFVSRCKMRHDFADQIQVRYRHSNGESYDTWVSGEEVLQRLRTRGAESRLRGLRRLSGRDAERAREEWPEKGKRQLGEWFRDRMGDGVEEFIGGNLIGDSLADAVRGQSEPESDEGERWRARLQQEEFRAVVLELAWINLRGSFPAEDGEAGEYSDWV